MATMAQSDSERAASMATMAQSDSERAASMATMAQSDSERAAGMATMAQSDSERAASMATMAQSDSERAASMATMAQSDSERAASMATTPGQTQEEMLEFYAKWSTTFDQANKDMRSNIGVIMSQRILQLYPERRDISILDCGAGTGLRAQELASHGFMHIDAVDSSREMLAEAAKKGVYKRIYCQLLGPTTLPIENDTYDLVICVGLFCPGHTTVDCLKEFIRVVKPGGHVYISTREVNFIEDEYLKKFFHAALQHHEAQGDWSCLKQEVIPGYLSDWRGFVAIFQVMEK